MEVTLLTKVLALRLAHRKAILILSRRLYLLLWIHDVRGWWDERGELGEKQCLLGGKCKDSRRLCRCGL